MSDQEKEKRREDERKVTLEKIKESLYLFRRFNKYILRYWKQEVILLILGNSSMAFALITPYLGKIILDQGILAKNVYVFIKFTILGIIIFFLRISVTNLNNYLRKYVVRKVKIDLAKKALRKVRKLSLRFFQEPSSSIECVAKCPFICRPAEKESASISGCAYKLEKKCLGLYSPIAIIKVWSR